MEMPKGWNRINQNVSEYKSVIDMEKMLVLIKDMAESIESAKTYIDSGYGIDKASVILENILVKYKEWK